MDIPRTNTPRTDACVNECTGGPRILYLSRTLERELQIAAEREKELNQTISNLKADRLLFEAREEDLRYDREYYEIKMLELHEQAQNLTSAQRARLTYLRNL
jgi:hypothetical protein